MCKPELTKEQVILKIASVNSFLMFIKSGYRMDMIDYDDEAGETIAVLRRASLGEYPLIPCYEMSGSFWYSLDQLVSDGAITIDAASKIENGTNF